MSQVKVEVEVGACKLDHDGSSFLDYSYEIRLTCVDMFEKRLVQCCSRCLLDFCDLEGRLWKLLAGHNLPSPFHNITVGIEKKHCEWKQMKKAEIVGHNITTKFINFGKTTGANISTFEVNSEKQHSFRYEPIFGGDRELYTKANYEKEMGDENFILKSSELQVWMQQLINQPDILDCDDFGMFFCPEEKSFRRQNIDLDEIDRDTISSIDYALLLPSKHIRTKTLLSKHTEKIEVQRGQIVLWRFSSSKSDVSFAVDLDGRSLLGAKKYPSSSEEVFGSLEMVSSTAGVGNLVGNGLCELKFENKYTKLMAPTNLRFYCRAVDPTEYVDCKRRAAEKIESSRKKDEALQTVMSIFRPRSEVIRHGRNHGSVEKAQDVLRIEDSANSSKSEWIHDMPMAEDSHASIIAKYGPEDAVRFLLLQNSKLQEENTELRSKCEHLQKKIDVVLSFANTNSSKPNSKKQSNSTESGSIVHKRRQTYAVHGDQESRQVELSQQSASTKKNEDISPVSESLSLITKSCNSGGETNTKSNDVPQANDKNEDYVQEKLNTSNIVIDLSEERHSHNGVAVLQKVDRDSDDEDSD